MKRYYFVDYDNIKHLNVKKENFDCKSWVYIFYTNSNNPRKIDLDSLQIFNSYAKKTEFIKVPDEKHLAGKFISLKVGMCVGEGGKDDHEYIILTPKTSFNSFVTYLQDQGVNIVRKDNFNEEGKKTEPKPVKKAEPKKIEVQVVEEKKEEVKQPEMPVVPVPQETEEQKQLNRLYGKIHTELSKTRNSNGNRYDSKVKGNVCKLVIAELKKAKKLEPIYNLLKERYVITYDGIYTIVRKNVLEVFNDIEDYEVKFNDDGYNGLRNLLAQNHDDEFINNVITIMKDSELVESNKQKNYIYVSLTKMLGKKDGGSIYHQIKDLLLK